MKRYLQWASALNLRIAIILVPLLVSAGYLLLFAADRYLCESVIAVRNNGEGPAGFDGLTALLGTSAPSSRQDESMLEAHILSKDMLAQLDAKLQLRQNFSAVPTDIVYRLSSNASQEKFLAYYRKRVEVVADQESGLLRIITQGFTPQLAMTLNREILTLSEQFINESSHRLAREQMRFAEAELKKARKAVDAARDALLSFQGRHGLLDPLAQAQANTGVTVELQGTLARQEAELKGLLGFLNGDAPQVQALRMQIAGTRAQLQSENRRGVTGEGGSRLNAVAGDYQQLLAELQYTQDGYKLALVALESARVESTRKLKSLVLVESPSLPESPSRPRRLYTLFAMLMGSSLLYGIVRLVVATIEDHQE